MCCFTVIIRRGAEQDIVGRPAEIAYDLVTFLRCQMLKDLNTDDEVVAARQWVQQRSGPAVGLYILPDTLDGILRDIDAKSLDAAIPQALDQEAHGAARIENGPGPDISLDMIGDTAKGAQPLFIADIGLAAAVLVVILIVRRGICRPACRPARGRHDWQLRNSRIGHLCLMLTFV